MGLFSKLFGKKDMPKEKLKEEHTFVRDSLPAETKPQKSSDTQPIIETPLFKVTINTSATDEIPPLQGDYAKAVFLSVYGKASPIKRAGAYQQYFLYECGIRDCPGYHRSLIEEGLLAPSTLEARLEALKVDTLKDMLQAKGLPVSGKKAVLIDRLLPVIDEGFVHEYVPEMTYAITEQGQAFLDEHSAYAYLHRHKSWGIDWKEFDKRRRPGYSTRDTIWGILNERVINDGDNFGRNEYLCMYQLLVEEGKRLNAIEMLLRIIYIDVSGVEGLTYLRESFWTLKEAREGFGIAVMLAPALIGDIAKYQDVYTDEIVDRLYQWKLPIQLCSKKQFLDMVYSCFEGTFDGEAFLAKLKPIWNKAVREARGK